LKIPADLRGLGCPEGFRSARAFIGAGSLWGQAGQRVPNYLGGLSRFASSCTDFVVADLSILELVGRPHAVGGFVICLANSRKLSPSGCNVDQYPDGVNKGLCWMMIWLTRIFTPHSRLFVGWRMRIFRL